MGRKRLQQRPVAAVEGLFLPAPGAAQPHQQSLRLAGIQPQDAEQADGLQVVQVIVRGGELSVRQDIVQGDYLVQGQVDEGVE